MANIIRQLFNRISGDKIFPVTHTNAVIDDSGLSLTTRLSQKADTSSLATVATSGSYDDLADKPVIPTAVAVDSTITQNGTNPVQGGAIYSALEGKAGTVYYSDVDEMNTDGTQISGTLAFVDDGSGFHIWSLPDMTWYKVVISDDLDSYVPTTRTINGKALSSNITLSASDVGANVFVVNIENDGSNIYTCDKTNAEIYAAWSNGRDVIADAGGYIYHLCSTPTLFEAMFSGLMDELGRELYDVVTKSNVQTVTYFYDSIQQNLISGTNIKTINNQSLLGSGNLTPSDLGAITRFVVDFTLSGTTISNPNKTFLEIKAAYDAGNLVLARDNNSSLYYLLYCDTGECGFFNCDSNYLYDINVNSSNVWRYQITDISQLSHDLSNKSEVIYMRKVNNVWRKLTYDSLNGNWIIDSAALTTGNIKNIYFDKDNNDLYYWDGSEFVLIDEDNVQPDWNQSDSTKADYIKNKPVISGGTVTVENVTDTGDVVKSLEPNIFYKFGTVNSLTIPLISGTDLAVYSGKFTIDSLSTALSFFVVPATVTTAYSCPTITAGNTYEFNILDNVLMMLEI